MIACFSQLSRVVEKKAHLLWHIEGFEQYIREDLNPLGLRIQIFPTFENIEDSIKTKWEKNLQQCSLGMMKLLMEEYSTRVSMLNLDIDNIYTQLKPCEGLEGYKAHEENIKIRLDLLASSTLLAKEQKFWRDKIAFKEAKAYHWHKTSNLHTSQKFNKKRDMGGNRGSNISLNSSLSSSSQISNPEKKKIL